MDEDRNKVLCGEIETEIELTLLSGSRECFPAATNVNNCSRSGERGEFEGSNLKKLRVFQHRKPEEA